MAENNSKREHLSATVILILMGGLATFGGYVLNSLNGDLRDAKNGIGANQDRIEGNRIQLQMWKDRVYPHDTWQSTSMGEMDRFIELLWHRAFPEVPYPEMKPPPPIVQP